MRKIKTWKCDFKGCEEIAEWYRKWKGEVLKLCTKHEAYFAGKHYGKSVNLSELDEDDLRYLEEKDELDRRRKSYRCGNCFYFGKPVCKRNERLADAEPCEDFFLF